MDILWPGFLALLGLVPLAVAGYIWMLRRRKRFTVRYSNLALVREAYGRQSRWRRHVPFALLLLALSSLALAAARPVDVITLPAEQRTIILAIDVSRSMIQSDIQPSRLEAAKAAALTFIDQQQPGTQIGVVAFAGFAQLVHPPTDDKPALRAAVNSLVTARRTAIGSGIVESLDVIADIDLPPGLPITGGGTDPSVPAGIYVPAIIVLLTDGVSTSGIPPLEAAAEASDRGVRIFTIGFGTENGDPNFGVPRWQNNRNEENQQFRFRRGIDEETLSQVAEMTGGAYYAASSALELQQVFNQLPTHLITRTETTEISVFFAAAAAALIAAALILSMIWHPIF